MRELKNDVVDRLIDRIIEGDRGALEDLFGGIQRFVMRSSLRQLGPFGRDLDCRAEVLARICGRFLSNDFQRLREYKARPERCFTSFLRVVMNRVAIDVARGMRENVAARTEHRFRWITTVELGDLDQAHTPDVDARARLHDVLEFLHEHAQPDDVEMLRRVVQGESWSEIAARHGTTPSAARQRVRRLRLLLESWRERPRSSRPAE